MLYCLEFAVNGAFILCFNCIFLFLLAFTINLTFDNIFSSTVKYTMKYGIGHLPKIRKISGVYALMNFELL